MKKLFLISIFIIITGNLFSQPGEGLSDGYKVFKYPNGSVSGEGIIRNGKPDGFWKSYYVTGVKKSEGKRTNFLLDSIWVFFDQAGDTTEKINYLIGKKNGYYFKYKKEPAEGLYIWSKELYAGDKKEGTAYVYFPDGKIKQTITYNGGRKEGLSKEFDKEGIIISLLEYSNDFLVSREKINRTDNKGLKQGDWKEFYPGGGKKSEKTFKDDLLHGYYKEYDIKGNLILTMLYENGSIVKSKVDDEPDIEIVNKYDQAGKMIYNGPYRNQVPVGIHREYSSDGKVINSKIYNDNGLLLSEGIVDAAGNKTGNGRTFIQQVKFRQKGSIQKTEKPAPGSFIMSLKRENRQAHLIMEGPMDYGNGIMKTELFSAKRNISRDSAMEPIPSTPLVVR
jgi:antitoxin component YwqK of YwqJK toxin-antitoxin module